MKNLFVFICFMFLIHDSYAQSLLDIYKRGAVKLVPDTEYAQGNQWEKVFETYYDATYGNRKSIVLTPDGSVVVNHPGRNFYSLFDANGKFIKEFGNTGSSGSGRQANKTKAIEGVINNNFFTGLDDLGKMVCFDFNGNFVKTLTLDYMAREIIPMANNKIAVAGWALWSDRTRDFVAIVDYQTNEQKIIWDHFTNRSDVGNRNSSMFNYSYSLEKRSLISLTTMPYSKSTSVSSPPQIAFVNNRLIVALPHNGEILTYDVNGKLLSKERIEWGRSYISVEEQKEIQKKAIERIKNSEKLFHSYPRLSLSPEEIISENKKAREYFIKQMEADLNKITTPIPIPVFSNIIKDSDGNLLFFEMPEENGGNKFNVWIYQDGSKFVCQSSFECDDYDLFIAPSKMVFHNGYIYGLQTLKKADGNPLRLVRLKVGN